jgi:hypothetical protein
MNRPYSSVVTKLSLILCALLLTGTTTRGTAQGSQVHPGYRHAIQELREAHLFLKGNYSVPAQAQAAAEALPAVESAIGELKEAAKFDDKSLSDMPVDNKLPDVERLRKVRDLLLAAHHDASGTETDPHAAAVRDRAIGHIDNASGIIRKAIEGN